MSEHHELSALPEAIPLRRVAPGWRTLAILALLASVLLLAGVVLLGVALLANWGEGPVPLSFTYDIAPPADLATLEPSPSILAPGAPGDPFDPPLEAEAGMPDAWSVPYPLRADLAGATALLPAGAAWGTAARRFLRLGKSAWKAQRGLEIEHVAVSSDGNYLAGVHAGRLLTGTVATGLTQEIHLEEPPGSGGSGGPQEPMGGPGLLVPGLAADLSVVPLRDFDQGATRTAFRPVLLSEPAWVKDTPVFYFAAVGPGLRRCRVDQGPGTPVTEVLPIVGDQPAPVPGSPQKLVIVRSRPEPKVEAPGETSVADPAEVVLHDLATGTEQVLVATSRSAWRGLAVSPDGSRLALVGNRGPEGEASPLWRVFVLELAGGEPKPLTDGAALVGPVCWTPDGKGLVYARTSDQRPADHLDEDPAAYASGLDLFHLELAANREVRLSRGGGFWSPNVDRNGILYYLTSRGAAPNAGLALCLVPLATAREFAMREAEPPAWTAATWQKLVERVLSDTGLSVDAEGANVTPEMLAKVADTFARRYEETFGHKPPASLEALDRLGQELAKLTIPQPAQPQLRLVVGAALGEFLRRQHGARWKLVRGPLVSAEPAHLEPGRQSPFAAAFNPFAFPYSAPLVPRSAETKRLGSQESALARAATRPLALTNAAVAGDELVRDLADPDLARGEQLLRQGKPEEGERVLREMLQREPHRANGSLALHVGKLLYVRQRYGAAADLMKRWSRKRPYEAQRFNLLGLALLELAPQEAVHAFRSALRCDLRYGPAYLNLALAYQKANNPGAASQCLQRYLELLPHGPLARDALRRLGELETKQPRKPAAPPLPGEP